MLDKYILFTQRLRRGVLRTSPVANSRRFAPRQALKSPKIRKLSDALLNPTGVSYSRSMGKVAEGEQPMHPQRMVRQALRLGLVVALVVLAVSACGGGGGEKEAKARPLPEDEKALRPGEYRTEEFEPSFTFRLGKGWKNFPPEAFDVLALTRGERMALDFVNAQEVYKPTKTGLPYVVEAPKDMVGWFQQHPYLQTDKPEPVTVGGVKGEQFDVVVENLPEDYTSVGGANCVNLFKLSTGDTICQPEEVKVRLIVMEDVKGETVTIGAVSSDTEFEEFLPEAQKVLDSVEWRGS
jgi:hypothetical protein